ncbi:receptor-like protein 9a [Gossypium hirsutum]|uniref:Receptor-like protein 9a n=1 Tax=Gossypium hirsutum TaxID=3635 RepID=A0ABM2ZXK5_GOSHI|nr:receptor-like protein 9a [Gossypium hirsutum]
MEITFGNSTFLPIFSLLLCMCSGCHRCMDEERDALLQIKDSINSPEGTAFSSWYGEDCCQWEGVQCNASTTRVSSIFFNYRRDPSLLENWYPNATLFAQFKDLEILHLGGNQIAGFTSPEELHSLKHLQQLNLQGNSIENASHLCWGKGALPSLYYLDLSGNNLQGFIPECLCDSLLLKQLILGNNLSGPFPKTFGNISSRLTSLDISNNGFYGPLLEDIHLIFPELLYLSASDNGFNGGIPPSFGRLKRLQYLDISGNKLHGEIPYLLTSNMSCLEYLDLSGNQLHGEIQYLLTSNMSRLQYLYLHDNNLRGDALPRNLSFLKLEVIHLGNNDFTGNLLDSLYWSLLQSPALPQLRVLSLSDNITSWSDFSHGHHLYLPALDLSSNRLTGSIPVQITQLIALRALNLSHNKLFGELSPELTKLTDLEVLDVSHDKLFGELCPEFTNLTFLEIFNVSFNNLSGTIPVGYQFSTFDASSYIGNPGLCGNPLSRNCGVVVEKPPKSNANVLLSNMATTNHLLFPCILFLPVVNFVYLGGLISTSF